jgi:hypothetical protein
MGANFEARKRKIGQKSLEYLYELNTGVDVLQILYQYRVNREQTIYWSWLDVVCQQGSLLHSILQYVVEHKDNIPADVLDDFKDNYKDENEYIMQCIEKIENNNQKNEILEMLNVLGLII